jgi:hypothetical protein
MDPNANGAMSSIGIRLCACSLPGSPMPLAVRSALVTEVEVRFTQEGANATRIDLQDRLIERFGAAAEKVWQIPDSEGGWSALLAAYAQAA